MMGQEEVLLAGVVVLVCMTKIADFGIIRARGKQALLELFGEQIGRFLLQTREMLDGTAIYKSERRRLAR